MARKSKRDMVLEMDLGKWLDEVIAKTDDPSKVPYSRAERRKYFKRRGIDDSVDLFDTPDKGMATVNIGGREIKGKISDVGNEVRRIKGFKSPETMRKEAEAATAVRRASTIADIHSGGTGGFSADYGAGLSSEDRETLRKNRQAVLDQVVGGADSKKFGSKFGLTESQMADMGWDSMSNQARLKAAIDSLSSSRFTGGSAVDRAWAKYKENNSLSFALDSGDGESGFGGVQFTGPGGTPFKVRTYSGLNVHTAAAMRAREVNEHAAYKALQSTKNKLARDEKSAKADFIHYNYADIARQRQADARIAAAQSQQLAAAKNMLAFSIEQDLQRKAAKEKDENE